MALPPKALEQVGHIRQAGEQLLGLTEDVLDLSRLEAGEMPLEHQPFALAPLLAAVRALIEPQATTKGLGLRFEVASALPERLCGDAQRLRQVLLNLLGNAVKFTDTGSVTLRVRVLGQDEPRCTLRFEVEDTGLGIAAEDQARVFEPFTQADASTTRRFGGTGLGLSIARQLVALMGGRIDLHSRPGKGSVFGVTLALDSPREEPPPGTPAARSGSETDGARGPAPL
jgi:signal transduction histidine kinase